MKVMVSLPISLIWSLIGCIYRITRWVNLIPNRLMLPLLLLLCVTNFADSVTMSGNDGIAGVPKLIYCTLYLFFSIPFTNTSYLDIKK